MSKNNGDKPPKATKAIKTPEGIIRRGTRVPFKKCTAQVMEQRVEEVAAYIRRNPLASRFALHKEFCPKFKVNWDVIDNSYVKRARALLAKMSNMSAVDARALGLSVVLELMDSPDQKIRLQAEKSFREIHGYAAPTQQRIGNPDGSPMAATVVQPIVNFIIPANGRGKLNGG